MAHRKGMGHVEKFRDLKTFLSVNGCTLADRINNTRIGQELEIFRSKIKLVNAK